MREIFTYGTVGRAPGNRCLFPEAGPGEAVHFLTYGGKRKDLTGARSPQRKLVPDM